LYSPLSFSSLFLLSPSFSYTPSFHSHSHTPPLPISTLTLIPLISSSSHIRTSQCIPSFGRINLMKVNEIYLLVTKENVISTLFQITHTHTLPHTLTHSLTHSHTSTDGRGLRKRSNAIIIKAKPKANTRHRLYV
jgi:hypothetical protein